MLRRFVAPHVFAGSSLDLVTEGARARAILHPPVRHGDLTRLAADHRPGIVLIVDGIFGFEMAVTPMEIRQAIEAGWRVFGAASMGAMRAAELWPQGMIGIGDIYTLFRTGGLTSDADVAVLFGGDALEEITISMVQVRFLIQYLRHFHALSGLDARHMHAMARNIYWAERDEAALSRSWRAGGVGETNIARFRALLRDPRLHPKKRDAAHAVASLLADQWIDIFQLYSHERSCTGDDCPPPATDGPASGGQA
jgi:hypothetical protein